jgi:hypothetical protein
MAAFQLIKNSNSVGLVIDNVFRSIPIRSSCPFELHQADFHVWRISGLGVHGPGDSVLQKIHQWP